MDQDGRYIKQLQVVTTADNLQRKVELPEFQLIAKQVDLTMLGYLKNSIWSFR
jgi:hypothetical protein